MPLPPISLFPYIVQNPALLIAVFRQIFFCHQFYGLFFACQRLNHIPHSPGSSACRYAIQFLRFSIGTGKMDKLRPLHQILQLSAVRPLCVQPVPKRGNATISSLICLLITFILSIKQSYYTILCRLSQTFFRISQGLIILFRLCLEPENTILLLHMITTGGRKG